MPSSSRAMPPSATSGWTVCAGTLTFLLGIALAYNFYNPAAHTQADTACVAMLILAAAAGAMFVADVFGNDVGARESSGLDFTRNDPSWLRVFYKTVGLAASFVFIGLIYWLFPEYHGAFYERYFTLLKMILPFWAAAAIPYFYLVDGKMREPCDSYYYLGRLVTGHWAGGAPQQVRFLLRNHLAGWLVRGFFLPLMFIYFCDGLNGFLDSDPAAITGIRGFKEFYDFTYMMFYFTEVGFAAIGYLAVMRLSDTHLRWADPTMSGWVVALVCYEPFWSLFSMQYFSYDTGLTWGSEMAARPLLYACWGSTILALLTIYSWATLSFGLRFSNLTHRGIITNGPYRFTKHPAYITKNITWWMISVPFLMQGPLPETLRHCALLALVNGIYFLRAKTEERNLSADPAYREYAAVIAEKGVLRFLRPPKSAAFLYFQRAGGSGEGDEPGSAP
jgi:protein-S-isoprenylcysteine O-methyltransferase Ste14